jgi:hypothetical protein
MVLNVRARCSLFVVRCARRSWFVNIESKLPDAAHAARMARFLRALTTLMHAALPRCARRLERGCSFFFSLCGCFTAQDDVLSCVSADCVHMASSLVIWYDSVIDTGELKWQNTLNARNEMFFAACDGLFTKCAPS